MAVWHALNNTLNCHNRNNAEKIVKTLYNCDFLGKKVDNSSIISHFLTDDQASYANIDK